MLLRCIQYKYRYRYTYSYVAKCAGEAPVQRAAILLSLHTPRRAQAGRAATITRLASRGAQSCVQFPATLPRSLTSRYIARIKAKWLARAHPICSQRRQTLHDDPQRSRRGCHRGVGSGAGLPPR